MPFFLRLNEFPATRPPGYTQKSDYKEPPYGQRVHGTFRNLEMLLKSDVDKITQGWTEEDSEYEHHMQTEGQKGGGLFGVDEIYHAVRNGLIAEGKVVLALREEQDKLRGKQKTRLAGEHMN